MDLVSVQEIAERKGISRMAANKQVLRSGVKRQDGKVDWHKFEAALERVRDKGQVLAASVARERRAKEKTGNLRGGGNGNGSGSRHEQARRRNGGRDDKPSYGDLQTLALAQRIKREQLKMDQLAGTVVDAAQVKAEVEARFREDAMALLDWPSKIAGELTSDLGLEDDRTVRAILEKHVRSFMRGRSRVPVDRDILDN